MCACVLAAVAVKLMVDVCWSTCLSLSLTFVMSHLLCHVCHVTFAMPHLSCHIQIIDQGDIDYLELLARGTRVRGWEGEGMGG